MPQKLQIKTAGHLLEHSEFTQKLQIKTTGLCTCIGTQCWYYYNFLFHSLCQECSVGGLHLLNRGSIVFVFDLVIL